MPFEIKLSDKDSKRIFNIKKRILDKLSAKTNTDLSRMVISVDIPENGRKELSRVLNKAELINYSMNWVKETVDNALTTQIIQAGTTQIIAKMKQDYKAQIERLITDHNEEIEIYKLELNDQEGKLQKKYDTEKNQLVEGQKNEIKTIQDNHKKEIEKLTGNYQNNLKQLNIKASGLETKIGGLKKQVQTAEREGVKDKTKAENYMTKAGNYDKLAEAIGTILEITGYQKIDRAKESVKTSAGKASAGKTVSIKKAMKMLHYGTGKGLEYQIEKGDLKAVAVGKEIKISESSITDFMNSHVYSGRYWIPKDRAVKENSEKYLMPVAEVQEQLGFSENYIKMIFPVIAEKVRKADVVNFCRNYEKRGKRWKRKTKAVQQLPEGYVLVKDAGEPLGKCKNTIALYLQQNPTVEVLKYKGRNYVSLKEIQQINNDKHTKH